MLLLLQATVQVPPLSGAVQLLQLLIGPVEQLVEVCAMVGELAEGLLLLLRHFNHLGGKEELAASAQLL